MSIVWQPNELLQMTKTIKRIEIQNRIKSDISTEQAVFDIRTLGRKYSQKSTIKSFKTFDRERSNVKI